MDIKTRIKNPVFWVTLIPAVTAFIYTTLGLFGIAPAVSKDEVINVLSSCVTLLSMLGVLIDPTTKGILDKEAK